MRLSRGMLAGGMLGAVLGVAFTVLSLFQYDSERTTVGEVVAVGLLIGVPISMLAGVIGGWIWELIFRPGR
ncbi:MAG: hypothetical protein WD208_01070 [Dehalococcoidia bacterium]